MRMIWTAVALIAAQDHLPVMQGARLEAGQACYAIVQNGTVVGATWQSVMPTVSNGRLAWDVVVHQRAQAMGFDMRDHFVVDRRDLSPISLDSQRGTEPSARGWQRISLRYSPGRVDGNRETAQGSRPIATDLDHKVWDGNLWGVTFAALPLGQGARFDLPFWQYDKGFGSFSVHVTGSERVRTPGGEVDAWVVEAGDDPAQMARYLIAKKRRRELGYSAGPSAQRLGGDCSGLR